MSNGKFDPDAYLASSPVAPKQLATPAPTTAFNPDTYLAQAPEAQQPTKPSVIESTVRGAAQGASLGFADEAAGALGALSALVKGGDVKEAYTKERDISRAAYKAAEEANPMASLAGNVAGSIATSFVPGLAVAKGAGLAKMAAQGALAGGVAGLGASEGQTLEEQASDVITGAGVGAAIPGLVGAAKGVGKLIPGLRGSSETVNTLTAKAAGLIGGVDEAGQKLYKEMLTSPEKHKAVRDAVAKIKGVSTEGEQGLEEIGSLVQLMHGNIKQTAQNAYSDTLKAGSKAALQNPGKYMESRVTLLKQIKDVESLIPTDRKDPFYNKTLNKTVQQVKGFLTGADPLTKAAGAKGKEEVAQSLAEAPLRARQAVDTNLSALRAKGETSGFVVERLKELRNVLDNEVKSLPGMAEMDALYGKYKEVSKALTRTVLDKDGTVNLRKLEGLLMEGGGLGTQGQRAKDWKVITEAMGRSDFSSLVGEEAGKALQQVTQAMKPLATSRALSRLGAETGTTTGSNIKTSLTVLGVGLGGGGVLALPAGVLAKATTDPAGYLKLIGMSNDYIEKLSKSQLAALAKSDAAKRVAQGVGVSAAGGAAED